MTSPYATELISSWVTWTLIGLSQYRSLSGSGIFKGPAKQCGLCFGCLGRRQAMLSAGVADPLEGYDVDVFGPHSKEMYGGNKMLPLKACLMQVINLRHFCETGAAPPGFFQHLANIQVAEFGLTTGEAIDLHRRYVIEWQPIIAAAKEKALPWANWIKRVGMAA